MVAGKAKMGIAGWRFEGIRLVKRDRVIKHSRDSWLRLAGEPSDASTVRKWGAAERRATLAYRMGREGQANRSDNAR